MKPAHALLAVPVLLGALMLGTLKAWRDPAPRPLPPAGGRDGEPARVEIRRPRQDLILTREPGGAWMHEKAADLADGEAASALLEGLRRLEFGPALEAGAVASGLGPADVARVTVLDGSGRRLFDGWFGRRVFARSAYFRAREDAPVRLASGLDPELLTRPASLWREPRLLPGGCPEGLEASAGGAWIRLDRETAATLCGLRASRWADETLEPFAGFDRPLLRVRAPGGGSFVVGERRGVERLVKVEGRDAPLRVPAGPVEQAASDLIGSGHERHSRP